MLKEFLAKMQYAINRVSGGLDTWWTKFDADGSNMIEFNEFLKMLEHLEIFEQQRNVYLMFHLFDRSDKGYFTYDQFQDVIYELF